ncbi:MAG: cobalamin B12-binding domain-containing protein, partial [Armatimonadetes bacterium]|nr:cobalamin B12-binding domain-containing protein [Armatimonadota bacterium]
MGYRENAAMKILLVFPRFRYPSGDPPMGVAYLAAVLRREGVHVEIFDATWVKRPAARLRQLIADNGYDMIGISTLTSMMRGAAEIARVAKELSPRSLVVMGGPHATVEPASTIALPGVDAVAVGEAELSILELVRAGLNPEGVPGFWFKGGGEVVQGPPAPLLEDLDWLPLPAWDLLDMRRYISLWYQLDAVRYGLKGTSIMASRGCPYDCTYCQPTLRKIFGPRIRRRSAESLIAEMIELRDRYRLDGLMWLDDTFLIDRAWMHDFCSKVIDARVGLIWGCNVRADRVDEETLQI